MNFAKAEEFGDVGVSWSDAVVGVRGEFMLVFELFEFGVDGCGCCLGWI